MKNRVGFTIRLNQKEQAEMALMADFFGKDHKEVTKLALNQLYVAVGQLSKKIVDEREPDDEESNEKPD
jgi:hypothetical protein